MTPERIKELKADFFDGQACFSEGEFEDLCDSALRLSAIEAAGDEEVESLRDSFYKLLPLNTLEARRCGAFDASCEIILERGQEIADLRAKLGECAGLLKGYRKSFRGVTVEQADAMDRRAQEIIAESEK